MSAGTRPLLLASKKAFVVVRSSENDGQEDPQPFRLRVLKVPSQWRCPRVAIQDFRKAGKHRHCTPFYDRPRPSTRRSSRLRCPVPWVSSLICAKVEVKTKGLQDTHDHYHYRRRSFREHSILHQRHVYPMKKLESFEAVSKNSWDKIVEYHHVELTLLPLAIVFVS
jgi:hypothetical protein